MGKPRRTNEERSAQTRARLLDATIQCLTDRGYAGTTTTEVSRCAGVSRGAQLHHFPSRSALVAAAVEHLFERRQDEFRRAFKALPDDVDRVSASIDLLWQIISGPTYYAWLELVVASRTSAELNEALGGVCRRLDASIAELFRELFSPPEAMEQMLTVGGTMVFAALEGMAASRIVLGDDLPTDGVLTILKTLAGGAILKPAKEKKL